MPCMTPDARRCGTCHHFSMSRASLRAHGFGSLHLCPRVAADELQCALRLQPRPLEPRPCKNSRPCRSTSGTAITKVLPPASRFSQSNGHAAKKQAVLDRLAAFFERYFGLA